MMRHTDGFDLATYQGAILKYKGYNATFNQGAMVAGRDGIGQALELFNTAFGEANYIVPLDAQSLWGFNMDWQWSGGTQPDMEWYRIAIGATVLLSLMTRTDGTMDILGPSGTLLVNTGSTSTGFQPGVWSTLELKVQFGVSGSVELRKNGVTAAVKSAVNFGATLPDTHTVLRLEGFGPPGFIIDNLIVWDGQTRAGDPFNDFYGRQRILSIEPDADLQPGEWQPSTPGPSVNMVADDPSTPGGSPDGDLTYLLAQATGPDAVFEMASSPCSGLILGLIWNACMRPDPNTATPGVDFVFIPRLSTLVVGHQTVTAAGDLTEVPALLDYLTYQVITSQNPDTMTGWQDTDISDGSFGVGASASPQLRLTAFYLEKLIDLTGKPFNCGGGTYSFGK